MQPALGNLNLGFFATLTLQPRNSMFKAILQRAVNINDRKDCLTKNKSRDPHDQISLILQSALESVQDSHEDQS